MEVIDYKQLSKDALKGVISDFILREGTDYGYETTFEDKIAMVVKQLESSKAFVVFNDEDETVSILTKNELTKIEDINPGDNSSK